MKRRLTITELAPISINSAYYNDRKLGYKAEVKHWLHQVSHQLGMDDNYQAVKDLTQYFNAEEHCLHVYLKFHNPNFYTKDGRLSARSFDLSNIEKVLIDAIFLSSHNCSLNIDDKYITRMVSEKVYGEAHKIDVTIHVKKLTKHPE